MTGSNVRVRTARAARFLVATVPSPAAMDAACLALRLALAWVFAYYGAAKLFGVSGAGPAGLHRTAVFMDRTAHLHPGMVFALVAGLTEFGGAVAMAVGLCTRLAALALFGDMLLAMITVTWVTGFDSRSVPPGYQLNVALAAPAAAVVFTGAGRLSLDNLIARALRRSESTGSPTPSRGLSPGRRPRARR